MTKIKSATHVDTTEDTTAHDIINDLQQVSKVNSESRKKHISAIELELNHTQDALEQINKELAIDPKQLEINLKAQQSALQGRLAALNSEKDSLAFNINTTQSKLVTELSSNFDNLFIDNISSDAVAIAMQNFIDRKFLNIVQQQEDNLAGQRKSAHEALTVNAKLREAELHKEKLVEGKNKYQGLKNSTDQKITEAKRQIELAKEKLSEANRKLETAKNNKATAEQNVVDLKSKVQAKQKEINDLKAYYDTNRTSLEGRKISEPQVHDTQCETDIAAINREYDAIIASNEQLLPAARAKRDRLADLDSKFQNSRKPGRTHKQSFSKRMNFDFVYGKDYYPLAAERPTPAEVLAGIESRINDAKSQSSTKRAARIQKRDADKAAALKAINDELNGKFSIASRDAHIDPLVVELKTLRESVATAEKDVEAKTAQHQNAIVEKNDKHQALSKAELILVDLIEECRKYTAMLEQHVTLIKCKDGEITELKEQKSKLKHVPSVEPKKEQTSSNAVKILNQELEELKGKRNIALLEIENVKTELAAVDLKLSNVAETSVRNKEELEKNKAEISLKLEGLSLKYNVINEEYNELLVAELLYNNIALTGFATDANSNHDVSLLACILQTIYAKYVEYDLNKQLNEKVPENYTAIIQHLLAKINDMGDGLDRVYKIASSINAEFASDDIKINLCILGADGSKVDAGIADPTLTLYVWEIESGQYVMLSPATTAFTNKYTIMSKLVLGFGISDTLPDLTCDMLKVHLSESVEQASISALTNYYGEIEKELPNIETFTQLVEYLELLANHATVYKSKLAIQILKHVANMESEVENKLNVAKLLNHVKQAYIDNLRTLINSEISRRDEQQGSMQDDELNRIQKQIAQNENKINDLEQSIAKQLEKIALKEKELKNQQDDLTVLAAKHKLQQQEIDAQLIELKSKLSECQKQLDGLEGQAAGKQKKLDSLHKTSQSLENAKQALEKQLLSIEQEWQTKHLEVVELEKSLNVERGILKQIQIEQKRATEIKEEALKEKQMFEIFRNFISKIHHLFKNELSLLKQRVALRALIQELKVNTQLDPASKAQALYKHIISINEVKQQVSVSEQQLITAELAKADGAMITQIYGVVSELIGLPNLKWSRADRKFTLTGYNLNWKEIEEEIKNTVITNLNSCGLGFNAQGFLTVQNLNYFGRISDLPVEIKSLVEKFIKLKRNKLDWDEEKIAYGKEAVEIIGALQIKYDHVLHAYVNDIEVIVGNNLDVDVDVIKTPGITLSIYAHNSIYCKESLTIDTSGLDALPYAIDQAPSGSDLANGKPVAGRHGLNGEDGLAGDSAGHIYIKAKEKIHNFAGIQCKANGGNGAAGQKGGDGEQGLKGIGTPDAVATDTNGIGRAQCNLAIARIPGVGPNGERVDREISGNGGNAGLGGLGGDGGFAGDIDLIDSYDEVHKPANGNFTSQGPIASKISAENFEAIIGVAVDGSAPRGIGGEPGEAGEVGLDQLLIKESFWVPTKIEKGYFDYTAFEKYKYALNRGWGHDIFGERAWIDPYCQDYREQYRVYGDWIRPRLLDEDKRRKRSNDTRSRGQRGEQNSDRTKDESQRQRAVHKTNNSKNATYQANVRQQGLECAQTKEWNAFENRCNKYIAICDQEIAVANVRLNNANISASNTSQNIATVSATFNQSRQEEQELKAQNDAIKRDLKSVKTQIQVADQEQLELLQSIAELKTKIIESKSTVACANIDIDSKKSVSEKLSQAFNQLKVTSNVVQNATKKEIGEEQKVLDEMQNKLEMLRNERVNLDSAYQALLLEKDKADRKGKHKLLEKQIRQIDKQEKIQVQAMLKYSGKQSNNDAKYVPDIIESTPKTVKAKPKRWNVLMCGSTEDVIELDPEPVATVREITSSLSLDEQYSEFIVNKHKPEQRESVRKELANKIKLAIAKRAEAAIQEAYFRELLKINDFSEIIYVIENTTTESTSSIANDAVMIEIAKHVAKVLKSDSVQALEEYLRQLKNTLLAMLDTRTGDASIVGFIQKQIYNLLQQKYKKQFAAKKEFDNNLREIINIVEPCYANCPKSEIVNVALSLIPITEVDSQQLFASFKQMQQQNSTLPAVYIELYDNLVDVQSLAVDQAIEFIHTVKQDQPEEQKSAMLELVLNQIKQLIEIAPEFADLRELILSPASLVPAEKIVVSLNELKTQIKTLSANERQKQIDMFFVDFCQNNLKLLGANLDLEQNLWLGYLDKLEHSPELIKYSNNYLFSLKTAAAINKDLLTVDNCRQIETYIIKLKNSFLNSNDMVLQSKYSTFVDQLETIVETQYMLAVEAKFSERLDFYSKYSGDEATILESKDKFVSMHKSTIADVGALLSQLKFYASSTALQADVVTEIVKVIPGENAEALQAIIKEKQQQIKTLPMPKANTLDSICSAFEQVLESVKSASTSTEYEMILKKIYLNLPDSSPVLVAKLNQAILQVLEKYDQLSHLAKNLIVKCVMFVINQYQHDIAVYLKEIKGAEFLKARLIDASYICNDVKSLNLLLNIHKSISDVLRESESNSIETLEIEVQNRLSAIYKQFGLNQSPIQELNRCLDNCLDETKQVKNTNVAAMLIMSGTERTPWQDMLSTVQKISGLTLEPVNQQKYLNFTKLAAIAIQQLCSMIARKDGNIGRNGQIAQRIAQIIQNLRHEIFNSDDVVSIKAAVTKLQSIAKSLTELDAANDLFNTFAKAHDVRDLLNNEELQYFDYISGGQEIIKSTVPHLWSDTLRNEFYSQIHNQNLGQIGKILDRKTKDSKKLRHIFAKGRWDYLTNNEEYEAFMFHLDKFYTAKLGNIDQARNSCKQVLEIVNSAIKSVNNDKLQVELYLLQALIVQALNFKEMLISGHIDAQAKNQEENFLHFIKHITTNYANLLELEDTNRLVNASCSLQDLTMFRQIIEKSEPNKIVHDVLILRINEAIARSAYTRDEQNRLTQMIKELDSFAYNTATGNTFLDLLGSSLLNTKDKTPADLEYIISTAISLKIYDNHELVNDLAKQSFIYWQIVLKRAKWQSVLESMGFDIKYPKLLDLIIALEKKKGAELVQALIIKLKDQPGAEVIIRDFSKLVKKFVSGEWELEQIAIDKLTNLPFNQWSDALQNHYASQNQAQERDTATLIRLMRDDKTGVNDSIVNLIETLGSRVDAIEAIYKEQYSNKTAEEMRVLITSTIKKCQGYGVTMYKDNPDLVNELIAAMSAGLFVKDGYPLRNTQIIALLSFIDGFDTGKGRLANIATGEGKSLVTALLAASRAIFNEKVDVITSSRLLAERDAEECKKLLEVFGVKVSNNCDDECNKTDSIKRDRYQDCQVIYGDIGSFQRDYLLSNYMQKDIRLKVGANLIVDEVDSMCIDNAETTLYISHRIEDLAHLKHLFVLIWQMVNSRDTSVYSEENVAKIIQLIEQEQKKGTIQIPSTLSEFVTRRLRTWVTNAYLANQMQPGSEYSIPKQGAYRDKVNIMDLYTGVEQINTQWSNGLHQFIQLKHNCALSDESLKAIFISNMNFLRQYTGRIYGMTGTLGADAELDLLSNTYGLDFFKLPRYQKERYRQEEAKIVETASEWLGKISKDVSKKLSKRREISETDKVAAQEKAVTCSDSIKVCSRNFILRGVHKKHLLNKITALNVELKKHQTRMQEETLSSSEREELISAAHKCKVQKLFLEQKLKNTEKDLKDLRQKHFNLKEELHNYQDIVENNTQRAILIIAKDQNDAQKIYDRLEQDLAAANANGSNAKYNLKKHDSAFDDFNMETLHPGDIVVATNIAGRGTDFKTSKVLEENGGLHVILSYMPPNIRVEVQAFGRTARQGNKGTGRFIVADENAKTKSIEALRDERDAKEAKRLAEFRLKNQPKIELENDLFHMFAALQEEISKKLDAKLPKEMLPNTVLLQLNIKSLQNHWSFWLDKVSDQIDNVYKDGRAPVIAAYEEFANTMRQMLDTNHFHMIKEPGELLKLGKYYYMLKNYAEAEKCYDEIIKHDPKFAGFAHYYKALCIFGVESGNARKKEARGHLKKAVKIFETMMSNASFSSEIIKALGDRKTKMGLGKEVDQFTESNAHDAAFLNIHLQASRDVLGTNLMQDSFVSGSFTKEDSAKIWKNIRKLRRDIIKDYRVSSKISVQNGELCRDNNPIPFPEQLTFCKEQVLNLFKDKVGKSLDGRTLEYEMFDNFVLTKGAFLQHTSAILSEQSMFELMPDAVKVNTGISLWFDRNDVKQFVMKSKGRVKIQKLQDDFGLTKEQVETLLANLEKQGIIKRSNSYLPTDECKTKLQTLMANGAKLEPGFMAQHLGITLPDSQIMHTARYEELIVQATACAMQDHDFQVDLPADAADKRDAMWSLFKDLDVIKYPSVKFNIDNDPEKKLDQIKESLKHQIKDLFKDVSDSDEREKMEQSIYDTLEKAIGRIKALPKLKIDPRDLQFYFQEGKLPPEIMDYMFRCCDEVMSLKKDAGWWDWGAFVVAIIGIVQLVVGVILSVITAGLAAYVGQVLISEGIGDILFAAQSMANGNFSWKAYGENKWQSLIISIACAGVGAAINGLPTAAIGSSFADAAVKSAIAKELAAQLIQTAITCGITLASSALSKEIAKLIFAELKKSLKNDIRNSASFRTAEAKLKAKMEQLYGKFSKREAEHIVNDAMQSVNLEQKIASQFTTHAMRISEKISSQLGKLAGSDKFAGIDKQAGSNLGNSTLAALGSIASILSTILKAADIVKAFAEISTNTGTIVDEFANNLDKAINRTSSNASSVSKKLSEAEMAEIAEAHFKKTVDHITTQIQTYVERHILSGGITQAIELVRAPTVNKLVESLSQDLNNMKLEVACERKLDENAHGNIELSAKDKSVLVAVINSTKVAEVYTPDNLPSEVMAEDIITEQGARNINEVIKDEGKKDVFIIHRNNQYFLIQPDFLQSLDNLKQGTYSNATVLRYFSHHAHRPIHVLNADGTVHKGTPADGFGSEADAKGKAMSITLKDNHFRPFIDGAEINIESNDPEMPDNSCAAQALVYIEAYEKSLAEGKNEKAAAEFAMERATNSKVVRAYISDTVDSVSNDPEMRDLYNHGFKNQYPEIRGGELSKDVGELWQKWNMTTRSLGALNCVGGTLGGAAALGIGGLTFPSGVGPVAGGIAATILFDDAYAGCSALINGTNQPTMLQYGLNGFTNSLGLSENYAMGLDFAAHMMFAPEVLGPGSEYFAQVAQRSATYMQLVGRDARTYSNLRSGNIFNLRPSVYHATSNPNKAKWVFEYINPQKMGPDNRFGSGFYLSLERKTGIYELKAHNATATHSVDYNLNTSKINTLDLTQPKIAREVGYTPEKWTNLSNEQLYEGFTKPIAERARDLGYDAILFPSARDPGANNLVIFSHKRYHLNFNGLPSSANMPNNFRPILKPNKITEFPKPNF